MSTELGTGSSGYGLHCRDCHLYFFGRKRSKCDRCGSAWTCEVPAWPLRGATLEDGCPATEVQP